MSEDISIHRAPGTCCPEPSCDHSWHGTTHEVEARKNGAECEGCGAKCKDCRRAVT